MEAGVQEQDRHLGQDQRGHVHHARALRLERRGQRDPLEPRLEQGPSPDLARVCALEALVQGRGIPPRGGIPVARLVPDAERETAVQQAEPLPKLVVNPRELSDLEMLTVGALSPLTGFMGEKDHRLILETMPLESGLPWSIPAP